MVIIGKFDIGDKLILKRHLTILGLSRGDAYGEIIDITDKHYIVKRFDDKIQKFSFANKDDVFIKWVMKGE